MDGWYDDPRLRAAYERKKGEYHATWEFLFFYGLVSMVKGKEDCVCDQPHLLDKFANDAIDLLHLVTGEEL